MLILDGHGSHVSLDFLWLCKQNQIFPLFLPPHATHLLQPLDLTGFSVVKSKYRQAILALATIDDAAPVKKERFITCYSQAREQSLTERVIRAGWKAAGLSPFNIDHVLRSSQMMTWPATPPAQRKAVSPTEDFVATPQRPQDLYRAQQRLQMAEEVSRRTRLLLHKASKGLSKANTRAAGLEAEV